jgi:hypothetical protein
MTKKINNYQAHLVAESAQVLREKCDAIENILRNNTGTLRML